jgi:hypothetical protein
MVPPIKEDDVEGFLEGKLLEGCLEVLEGPLRAVDLDKIDLPHDRINHFGFVNTHWINRSVVSTCALNEPYRRYADWRFLAHAVKSKCCRNAEERVAGSDEGEVKGLARGGDGYAVLPLQGIEWEKSGWQ